MIIWGEPVKAELLMRKKKALIIGAYGFGNIGDEAILSGLLKTIDYVVTVFSGTPAQTAVLHKVHAEKRNLRRFLWCDELIIGGGEIFQDGMAWKFSLAIFLAKLLAKKVRAVGIGVDVSNPVEKLLTSLSLKLTDEVSVRDKRSFEHLVDMGLNSDNIKLVDDFASYLKPEPTEETELLFSKHDLSSGNFILLVLRPTSPETDRVLLTFFKRFITDLNRKMPDLKIVAIPFSKHQDSARDDDTIILQKLKDNVESGLLIVSERQADPAGILYLVSRANLVITTRLHPLIFSNITRTKAVAIPLFPKIRSFAEQHGFPIVEVENLEELFAMVEGLR
jgi:polysaccharide pyruvyl transferase WcaK-like protein